MIYIISIVSNSQHCPVKHFSDFYYYFYFYGGIILLCIVASLFLINANPTEPPEFLVKKVVHVICRNLDVALFFVVLFVTGMLTGEEPQPRNNVWDRIFRDQALPPRPKL